VWCGWRDSWRRFSRSSLDRKAPRAAASAPCRGTATAGVTAWATKPSTDLQLASSTAGPFTPLTTGGYTLSSSGATATLDLPVAYKVLLDWGVDTPGQCSHDVVYSVTAP